MRRRDRLGVPHNAARAMDAILSRTPTWKIQSRPPRWTFFFTTSVTGEERERRRVWRRARRRLHDGFVAGPARCARARRAMRPIRR